MKKIPLTQGQFALVDDEDFERVNAFKWYARFHRGTNSFYAYRKDYRNGKTITVAMSRFIANTPKGMVCDHVNHDTLDNRKSNLRNCSQSENISNIRVRSDNKTGHKNISKHSNYGYSVEIQINKKKVYHKWFPTLEKAIEARDKELNKYKK